jgi:imidazolonepropionase
VEAKTRSILVRGARELLTLRGVKRPRRGPGLSDLGIITDGSLLIRDGIVVEAGSTRRVENLAAARGAIEINAAGRVVMPGFVDSHTHLVFPPPHDQAQRQDALRANHSSTTKRLQASARNWLEAMARHGTTTTEVKTGCYPDLVAELKLLRVLLASQEEPLTVVPTFLLSLLPGAGVEEVDRLWRDFLPAIRRRGMIQFADVTWEDGPAAARFLEFARNLGLQRKIHAAGAASGAVEAAVSYRALSVDHIEAANLRDAELLAGSSTVATLLPAASCSRDYGFAPARTLIDAGAAVALASDFSPHHVSTWNMQAVIGLACRYMRMSAAEAISAATINGAHAAGCAEQAGSLEPGKRADLLLLNISDYRELAMYFGVNLVFMTMKRGEIIYQESEVTRSRST